MISPDTLRQWFPPLDLAAELDARLALRRQHREIERQLHGRAR